MAKNSPAAIKQLINYFYLLSFCPPEYIDDLKKASHPMRRRFGLDKAAVLEPAIPEAAMRIVAFQQATRQPEDFAVEELAEVMIEADQDTKKLAAFQQTLREIAMHPGRAKAANRLHRNKGCAFCKAPCQYGFFTLMSDPNFKQLKAFLDEENKQLVHDREPVRALWAYTGAHLWGVLGTHAMYLQPAHLGNLSYCLLMLGTAKSRFAIKEKEITAYQELNQQTIASLDSKAIALSPAG
jgi:hypothetical protein